jgi:hypothetical protein
VVVLSAAQSANLWAKCIAVRGTEGVSVEGRVCVFVDPVASRPPTTTTTKTATRILSQPPPHRTCVCVCVWV